MAVKYSAFGTSLKVSDGAATPVFTIVAGVQDIDGPKYSTDEIDVTAHDSLNAFEEAIPTIKRASPITIPIVYDPANVTHQALVTLWQNRTVRDWQIIAPDAGAEMIQVAAFIKDWGRSYPVAGALMADLSLRPTGQPTITP